MGNFIDRGNEMTALYFLASEESEAQNRAQFKNMAAGFLHNSLLESARTDSWDVIFQAFIQETKREKVFLIPDEFQYLGKSNPAFPSVFQRIWEDLKKENIMVILCGSLVSMMEAQTLSYGSPLYGRRTARI